MHQTVSNTYTAWTKFLFHCHIKIKIPTSWGLALLEQCFALFEQIDRRYNSYQRGSYFDRINRQAGSWVDVDDATIHMLRQVKEASACVAGAYDITCMPLLQLWGFYRDRQDRCPSTEEIALALQRVDYRTIEMENNRVRIPKGMELTTGSFIKSWAVDQVVKFLQAEGLTDAVINAGGSSLYGINNVDHPTWKINLPSAPTMETMQLQISNQAFSLSARTHNKIHIQGKDYGHILSCTTGNPSNTLQTGVWSTHAFTSDILATALFAVEEQDLPETLSQLQSIFSFDYFRIEENGAKISSVCF